MFLALWICIKSSYGSHNPHSGHFRLTFFMLSIIEVIHHLGHGIYTGGWIFKMSIENPKGNIPNTSLSRDHCVRCQWTILAGFVRYTTGQNRGTRSFIFLDSVNYLITCHNNFSGSPLLEHFRRPHRVISSLIIFIAQFGRGVGWEYNFS